MNLEIEIQASEAQNLRNDITRIQRTYIERLDRKRRADDAHRDAVQLLDDAENEVRVRAELLEDERLPKAKTSDGYKAAMRSIVAEVRINELVSEVEEFEQTRRAADGAALELEKARIELRGLTVRAQLQVAILTALAGTE